MKKWLRRFWSLTLCLLLAGCISVGPDYEPPEVTLPDAWNHAVEAELQADDSPLTQWWTVYNDPTLNGLIEQASTNNLDLRTALARIEEAAALRGVSASQFFPEIIGSASASAVQTTEARTPSGTDREGELYSAGLAMAWELDLWGRIRRSVESADASLQARVEDYRDVMVVLYADLAANYITVRTLQERIDFAEANRQAQTDTLELTRNRFDAGLAPALDVSQAQLNLSRTEALIPQLEQSLAESITRLGVLTGQLPNALQARLVERQPIPVATDRVDAGLPSELLRRRPDIRRAERELAAQHALIGATQAELYPTLTLPGSLTVESDDGALFNSANTAYSIGPQLRWSLFNGRRIRSRVDAEEAATEAALLQYEKTVLLALEEVEDTLSAYRNEQRRMLSLESAAASAEKSVELVNELYTSGLTDFQNVLNMEQALLTQQDALAQSKGQTAVNLARIYKALGGGWTPEQFNEN